MIIHLWATTFFSDQVLRSLPFLDISSAEEEKQKDDDHRFFRHCLVFFLTQAYLSVRPSKESPLKINLNDWSSKNDKQHSARFVFERNTVLWWLASLIPRNIQKLIIIQFFFFICSLGVLLLFCRYFDRFFHFSLSRIVLVFCP